MQQGLFAEPTDGNQGHERVNPYAVCVALTRVLSSLGVTKYQLTKQLGMLHRPHAVNTWFRQIFRKTNYHDPPAKNKLLRIIMLLCMKIQEGKDLTEMEPIAWEHWMPEDLQYILQEGGINGKDSEGERSGSGREMSPVPSRSPGSVRRTPKAREALPTLRAIGRTNNP